MSRLYLKWGCWIIPVIYRSELKCAWPLSFNVVSWPYCYFNVSVAGKFQWTSLF